MYSGSSVRNLSTKPYSVCDIGHAQRTAATNYHCVGISLMLKRKSSSWKSVRLFSFVYSNQHDEPCF